MVGEKSFHGLQDHLKWDLKIVEQDSFDFVVQGIVGRNQRNPVDLAGECGRKGWWWVVERKKPFLAYALENPLHQSRGIVDVRGAVSRV